MFEFDVAGDVEVACGCCCGLRSRLRLRLHFRLRLWLLEKWLRSRLNLSLRL